MNIILFGPPGIGKSTIIGLLKTKGFGAIDLEDLYPNRIRYQIPNLVKDKVLGAADLNPKRRYTGAIKVLLTADQATYDARREARDSKVSGKASQDHHLVENWNTPNTFDRIIDTSKLSAERTAEDIIRILRGGDRHEAR